MDSKTETVSDDELIAQFMNINVTSGFNMLWIVDEEDEMPDYKNGTVYSPSTNWNQLMPVVEKIEDVLLQVSIHTAYVNICGELNGVKYNQDTCFESQDDTKITVTYRAVLRAIHFINSNPPQQLNREEMKTEMVTNRKKCPKCGRNIKLNKDGLFLGHHTTKPQRGTYTTGTPCPGSYTQPLSNNTK